MQVQTAYFGSSAIRQAAGGRVLQFAPDLSRERVSFNAPLKDPVRFREAISALHDVVINDLRYKPRGKSAYEACKGIKAGGATACGVPLEQMIRANQYVEQIVLITDEGENTPPSFLVSLRRYQEALKADPTVCIVRTPDAYDRVERQCQRDGVQVDVFQFAGDYYALPNLVPLLSRPSKLEFLMSVSRAIGLVKIAHSITSGRPSLSESGSFGSEPTNVPLTIQPSNSC